MTRPWLKLYGRKRWQVLRSQRLAMEPLCRMCKDRFDRVRPATVVDHIKPHKGDDELFHDPDNLQSLCKECHDIHKKRMEMGALPRHEFGRDGYPVDNT